MPRLLEIIHELEAELADLHTRDGRIDLAEAAARHAIARAEKAEDELARYRTADGPTILGVGDEGYVRDLWRRFRLSEARVAELEAREKG